MRDLVQDSDGFVWLATEAGLVRYDGARMRVWSDTSVNRVRAGPGGRMVARGKDYTLYDVDARGMKPVAGPDGRPLTALDAAFTPDGGMWIANHEVLQKRSPERGWETPPEHLRGETILRVHPTAEGSLLLLTHTGLWERTSAGVLRQLLARTGLLQALPLQPGRVLLASWDGVQSRVLDWQAGQVRERLALPTKILALARRRDVVWIASDGGVVSLRPDGTGDALGRRDGIVLPAMLLVDAEETLWVAMTAAVVTLPEPETVFWTDEDGLPAVVTSALEPRGTGWLVATTSGIGRLDRRDDGWSASATRIRQEGPLCTDGAGRRWVLDGAAWRALGPAAEQVFPLPPDSSGIWGFHSCAPAAGGALWLLTDRALFLTRPRGAPLRLSGPEEAEHAVHKSSQVLEDRAGTLWVTGDRQICRVEARALAASSDAGWRCEVLPAKPTALVEMPDGTLWASAFGGVVLRRGRTGWLAVRRPAWEGRTIWKVVPSAAGGAWVLGSGLLERVGLPVEGSERVDVLETLDTWQGVPPGLQPRDLHETADGGLWIATDFGVVSVPARARRGTGGAPGVALVGWRANGRPAGAGDPALAPGSLVELQFAALSFRDPARLRYRMRVDASPTWTETSERPVLALADLRPGPHRVEVTASLDGTRWSAVPAAAAFEVSTPWYRRPAALALFGLALLALAFTAHRMRVAVLLGLERQRTRIAMDLHDEVGSALGSVGLLAAVAADDGVGADQRAALARRIMGTAAELGTALGDIVWELRDGPVTLEDLASRIAGRAAMVFGEGAACFEACFPASWPRVELSRAVRREVPRIAFEALHNAARHARAARVVAALEPDGARWRLTVSDDGRGLQAPAGAPGGQGLGNMRGRAARIGAALSWSRPPGGGTLVTLVFDPRARPRDAG